MREQRRLAAILAADVVGYSRLMGRDESGTLAGLREHRKQRFEPLLARYGGRLVKLMGDGALAVFPSAVDALSSAISFQQAMADANRDQPAETVMVFRIGLHLGDLIVEGEDLYGDSVNVAARLEAEATPGGIVVSGDVYNAAAGRLPATFQDLGRLPLKNIERPAQAYAVRWQAADWPPAVPAKDVEPTATALPSSDGPLALPDKPSIAVLPFENMSGDPTQEPFADGMAEDILSALSRFQNLFVIARNSSFTYKGHAVDVKKVGKELGVRYVLEGSVRTARERIRVTAQLIDATTSHHVWAERYDRALTDIFDIQDDLTSRIVSAIDFEVRNTEALRPSGAASAGLQVWAQYHAALPLLFRLTAEENRRAAALFDAIRASHPAFAAGYAGYGFALTSDAIYGWAADRQAAAEAALQPCRRAVELDDKDAFCHLTLGRALLIAGERDLGFASVERAVARNPNLALAHMFRGMALVGLERHAEALDSIDLAIRLSPRDPGLWSFYLWRSACRRALGDFAGAVDAAHQMVRERPDLWLTHIELATALVEAQQPEAGKAAVRKALELHPSATVEELARVESLFISPSRVRESRRIAAGLGLPSRKTT